MLAQALWSGNAARGAKGSVLSAQRPQMCYQHRLCRGKALKGITGRDLEAAGITQYGPRTVFCVAFKEVPGCHEFLLQVRRH